jgi:hypothetical protein
MNIAHDESRWQSMFAHSRFGPVATTPGPAAMSAPLPAHGRKQK